MNQNVFAQAGFIVATFPSPGKMVIENTMLSGAHNINVQNTIAQNVAIQKEWAEPIVEVVQVEKVVKNFKTGAGLDRSQAKEVELVKASYEPKPVTTTKLDSVKLTLVKKTAESPKDKTIDEEDRLFKKSMAY